MDKKLSEITDHLAEQVKLFHRECVESVNRWTEKLIPVLLSVRDINWDETHATVRLDYIKSHLAIRYCGIFFNMFIIDLDENYGHAAKRVKLMYAYDEGDLTDEQYKDDGYGGEIAHSNIPELYIEEDDIFNFQQLVFNLEPFLRNSDKKEEYEILKKEIINENKARDVLYYDVLNECQEMIDDYFCSIFNRYIENHGIKAFKENKKHFILFPYDIGIRYRGHFHNCLVKDDYCYSLGYLKTDYTDCCEEDYFNDPYTINYDASRYNSEKYQLIHEKGLILDHKNHWNVLQALSSIVYLYEDKLNNLDCKYISANDVNYKKTIFTEK